LIIGIVVIAVIAAGAYMAFRPSPDQNGDGDGNGDGEEVNPIKIGCFYDTTATAATNGQRIISAAEMAAEEINEAGGVLGRPIEIVSRDTASDALTGVAAMRRLVEVDQVHALNGPIWSSISLACLDVSNELKVPWINTASTHRKLGVSGGEGGYPYFFHTKLVDFWFFSTYVDVLVNQLGQKTFVGVFRNDDWGHQVRDILIDYLDAYGGELLEPIYFEPGETNYLPALTRIKEMQPDGIIPVGPTVDFVRQWNELGLSEDIPLYWRSFTYYEWVRLLGEDVIEGVWGVDQYTAVIDHPGNVAFVEKFYEKNEVYPIANDGLCYEGIYMIAQAIEEAGSTDPDAIVEALQNIEFESPLTGWTITFDEYHNGSGLIQIYKVENGEPVIVESTNTDEIVLLEPPT
jgi:branched-chain amino acid transport system substrate-binding protein